MELESRIRNVMREEVEDLADLLGEIFGLNKLYSKKHMVAGLRRGRSRRGTFVISEDGRPVSHIRTVYDTVSVFGASFRVASIGSVATHPDYRGRGYAGAVLERCLDDMRRKNASILIVSGERSLYRRNHCVPAGRLYQTSVTRENLAEAPSGLTVSSVTPEEWPGALARLYQAEPVRFVRSADFLGQLCFWWNCNYPRLWLVESGGEPLAYAMLSVGWPRDPESRTGHLTEYAGSRAALLDAMPAILKAADLDTAVLNVLGHDREMRHLLDARGVSVQATHLSGTHRLLDLPGLMKRLRPYLRERLPRAQLRRLSFDQEGETCIFAYDDRKEEMDLSDAARVVLDGPGRPEIPGELGRVLSAVLPLPFPMPGFNYI